MNRSIFHLVGMGMLVCLVAGVQAQQPTLEQAIQKEHKLWEGRWRIESGKANGEALPDEFVQMVQLRFSKDKLNLEGNDNFRKDPGTITLVIDPTTMPKIIDFKITQGDNPRTLEGIYELKDDTFRFCVQEKNRPDSLESTAQGQISMVLKRVK